MSTLKYQLLEPPFGVNTLGNIVGRVSGHALGHASLEEEEEEGWVHVDWTYGKTGASVAEHNTYGMLMG